MDKGWREKSSLMHLSVRVKHSIANLQAATQEQNVVSSQDQTSANLSSIRERWISFDAGARPPPRSILFPTPPTPLWVETRCMGLHGATAPFAQVPAWAVGPWNLLHPAACSSRSDWTCPMEVVSLASLPGLGFLVYARVPFFKFPLALHEMAALSSPTLSPEAAPNYWPSPPLLYIYIFICIP